MSMAGGIGASIAAQELLSLIARLKSENKTADEILAAIQQRAAEIKLAGDSGWY